MTWRQLRRVCVGDVLRYRPADGSPAFRVRVDHNGPQTVAGEVITGEHTGKRWLIHHDSARDAAALDRLSIQRRARANQ